MRHARSLLSCLLSVTIVLPILTACGGGGGGDRTAEATSALASGGVGVYDSYAAQSPVAPIAGTRSAMRLTRWQLANMLAQANAGTGLLGSALDRMEGPKAPKRAPTISYFIAAWLVRGASPLAQYAKQFMPAKPDYRHAPRLVFPLLVITLFVADAARFRAGAPPPSEHKQSFFFQRLIAAPAEASGICSTVTNFISQTITDVENALTTDSSGFFATLWNTVVHLVVGLSEVIIGGVLYPLLSILTAVAGGLAALTAIASSLQPWSVQVQPQPPKVTLGGQATEGKMVALLDAPSIDWPSELSDCTQALTGVQLDKISYVNAPVTWFETDSIGATVTNKDAVIGADKSATLTYSAPAHAAPPNAECAKEQLYGSVTASAKVERIDVQHAEEQLANLLFGRLPPVVQQHLMPIFGPLISQAQQKFAQLVATPVESQPAHAEVDILVPDSSKCTPSPQPSAPPSNAPASAPPGGKTSADLVGSWACLVHTVGHTAIGPLDVSVHVYYVLTKNGMAQDVSHSGAVWSSVHKVDVEAGGPVKGSVGAGGPYSYTPDSPNSGTLQMDGTHHLTWSGNNAWSIPIHRGQYSGTMNCSRM